MKILIEQSKIKGGFLCFIICIQALFSCSSDTTTYSPVSDEEEEEDSKVTLTTTIPAGGNSWIVNDLGKNDNVSNDGVHNWVDLTDVIRTFFHTNNTGKIGVGLKIKSPEGTSVIKVTVGGKSIEVEVSNAEYEDIYVGEFEITKTGYNYIDVQGVSKAATYVGDLTNVQVGGPAANNISFIEDEANFYFGRRGPSVHLGYEIPAGKDITWFYNEVTVPEGNDVIGSYFMANGFSNGYFGMQVNSQTERRVLFSVWSAFDTQDPNQIPDDYKVIPLGNGSGVTVGEFGNEGSGAQSYMIFDWKPATTYKFLLKGESLVDNSIDYTAYFYAPEVGDWKPIASFRKPKTADQHVISPYSFLENFIPNTGYIEREVNFGNQWGQDTGGNWVELTTARYTADATAREGVRLDYDGGANGHSFYLRNCGFFSDKTNFDVNFSRTANGVAPVIDFSKLEVPAIINIERTILDRTSWTVDDYSTQEDQGGEGDTGRASDILDGDLDTYWHSCWSGCTATAPHHITIDMGDAKSIDGFKFSQRQSLSRAVKDIELQISTDNSTWESPGDFTLQNTASEQFIDLAESKDFRYFKFIVKSTHDDTNNAAMAEVSTYTID